MNKQNIDILQSVFNALVMIETKGENTIIMAQCLQALQSILQSASNADSNDKVSAPEKE